MQQSWQGAVTVTLAKSLNYGRKICKLSRKWTNFEKSIGSNQQYKQEVVFFESKENRFKPEHEENATIFEDFFYWLDRAMLDWHQK